MVARTDREGVGGGKFPGRPGSDDGVGRMVWQNMQRDGGPGLGQGWILADCWCVIDVAANGFGSQTALNELLRHDLGLLWTLLLTAVFVSQPRTPETSSSQSVRGFVRIR